MVQYYVFIVSSLNHPIYRAIHHERKSLLETYQVPYTVLINEEESPLENESVSTLVPMMEDEVLYPRGGYNPFMTQKFLNAVKLYFRSFADFDQVPDFIIRTNATVYVHFPGLEKILHALPKQRVLAGPCYHDCSSFVNGMVMIFSKDVLKNILQSTQVHQKSILQSNDDVALTKLSQPFADRYNIKSHFVYPDPSTLKEGSLLYDMKKINPLLNQKWFFRICSDPASDRSEDMINFRNIRSFFEKEPNKMDLMTISPLQPKFLHHSDEDTKLQTSQKLQKSLLGILYVQSILIFLLIVVALLYS